MNRQIFHGAAASVVYTATTVLAGVVQLRLVIGALVPAIAGLWLLFLTVGSYVAWLDLGMSPTVAREISFAAGALAVEFVAIVLPRLFGLRQLLAETDRAPLRIGGPVGDCRHKFFVCLLDGKPQFLLFLPLFRFQVRKHIHLPVL